MHVEPSVDLFSYIHSETLLYGNHDFRPAVTGIGSSITGCFYFYHKGALILKGLILGIQFYSKRQRTVNELYLSYFLLYSKSQ